MPDRHYTSPMDIVLEKVEKISQIQISPTDPAYFDP